MEVDGKLCSAYLLHLKCTITYVSTAMRERWTLLLYSLIDAVQISCPAGVLHRRPIAFKIQNSDLISISCFVVNAISSICFIHMITQQPSVANLVCCGDDCT